VQSIEYEGKVFLVHLVTASGESFVVSHAGDRAPEEGSEVGAGWTRSATHVFAKSDGHRLEFNL
jgi:hypothetical protein